MASTDTSWSNHLRTQAHDQLALEADLGAAIDHDEIEVHYQPQFDMKANSLVGFEALARWNRPNFGWIPPLDFIPVSEESGLIDALGEAILAQSDVRLVGMV